GNLLPRRPAQFRARAARERCDCGGRWRWPARRQEFCPCERRSSAQPICEPGIHCEAITGGYRRFRIFDITGPGARVSPLRDTDAFMRFAGPIILGIVLRGLLSQPSLTDKPV